MTSPAAKKEPERPSRWRDHIEAATMAIVVAVMLKYFAIEAYQIPSGSMQPTLMGSPEANVFDRILVDKLSFHLRDPERWEVCVFKYPLDRSKSFIKRLVGMPGEELRVLYGDLWTRANASEPWKVLRRPEPVQEVVWKRLDPAEQRYLAWKPDLGARTWVMHGREGFEARGSGAVRLPAEGDSIRDLYCDGYPESMTPKLKQSDHVRREVASGFNDVGDVRVEGRIAAKASLKSFTIELREGERTYSFVLPGPAAPQGLPPWKVDVPASSKAFPEQPDSNVLKSDSRSEDAKRLAAGSSVSFAVQNMDDLVQLEVDGDVVWQIEVPAASDQRSSITLRVDGDADLDRLQLYRDIFYTQGPGMRSEFVIPADSYVFMGDNTQDSSDSREWKLASYKWEGPGSNGEWVRGNRRGNPSSLRDDPNPKRVIEAGGARLFFRDEWGELHTFRETPGCEGPLTPASYVPRGLITGRAVLVFWPWWPMTPGFDSTRLKWIR
ncbi:MAG: signal peptidase I [Planctomycetes bacterium]|nr:signal peptidase I [Planctomycetota bacterium]